MEDLVIIDIVPRDRKNVVWRSWWSKCAREVSSSKASWRVFETETKGIGNTRWSGVLNRSRFAVVIALAKKDGTSIFFLRNYEAERAVNGWCGERWEIKW